MGVGFVRFLLFLLLASVVVADCDILSDNSEVSRSLKLCVDTFDIPSGVKVTGSNIVLDCNGAILRGDVSRSNIGLHLVDVVNVSVRNCNILTFHTGILLENTVSSVVEDSGLLKNAIGVRLLNSFENSIVRINDKSRLKAVSVINSKFNIISLDNKRVDDEFCSVNACNVVRDIDACVSGDFYCGINCVDDSDCGVAPVVESPVVASKEAPVSVPVPVIDVPAPVIISEPVIPFFVKILLSVIVYFVSLWFLGRR